MKHVYMSWHKTLEGVRPTVENLNADTQDEEIGYAKKDIQSHFDFQEFLNDILPIQCPVPN